MGVTVLFGGTFNPPHLGHRKMLETLQNLAEVDEILVMPAAVPPHKVCDDLAPNEDRIEMCRLLAKDFSKARIETIEMARDGKSYTVDTVRILQEMYPQKNFAVSVGGDMVATLNTWHEWDVLKSLVPIFAFCRKDLSGFDNAVLCARQDGADITVLKADIPPFSSTAIRKAVNSGELPQNTTPEIAAYIRRKHLYLGVDVPAYENYILLLQERLKPRRFYHSLCVADEALRLARKYGADMQKAYLAGLLHDVTKNASQAEHFALFDVGGVALSEIEKSAEKLWHAASGAVFIAQQLHIEDPEILEAIQLHTTADEKMSLLAKVLYLADFTSADRDYDDVDEMRRLVDCSVADAMCYALRYTVMDLAAHNRAIHPKTIAAFNEVMLKRSENSGN